MNQDMIQGIQQIKFMMKQMQTLQNPNIAIQQMAQSNPQIQQVMQMCQGQNPKDIFYSMCKQRGVDPNEIINMLKS